MPAEPVAASQAAVAAAAAGDLRFQPPLVAALTDEAAETAPGEPLPPCLTEMVKFLKRRLDDQAAQVEQIRADIAARTRVVRAFNGIPAVA